MFRFLHAADIHLDSPLRGLESYEDAPVEEIRNATRRAFDNLIDLAIEESVDFVLIVGDLFDGDWKDFNTGLFFVNRMGRLNKARIPVYIVTGNHDAAASQITTSMALPDNVTLFSAKKPSSTCIETLGVLIHGQSYPTRVVMENIASQYPQNDPNYFNIGLLHTALNGREGHEPYAPCSLDDLRSKGYDYWALGHIHTREKVSQDPWIVFPGNIQGRHIRETGSKGATIVTVEDGLVRKVTHRELDVVRWILCRINLSSCETTEAVHEQIRSAIEDAALEADGKTLALRLSLEGHCSVHAQIVEHRTQWAEEIRGWAASLGNTWIEKIKFRTQRKARLEDMLGTDTPLSGLLQSIQNLQLDAETLLELVPEFTALKNKLPPELLSNEDYILGNDPEKLEIIRLEAQDLLIEKLLQHGESE